MKYPKALENETKEPDSGEESTLGYGNSMGKCSHVFSFSPE